MYSAERYPFSFTTGSIIPVYTRSLKQGKTKRQCLVSW